jgi:hypothetical protein
VTALVSDDPTKLKALSKKYRVEGTSHAPCDECLQHVDAVHRAAHSLHAEYTIRAARAASTCSARSPWRSRSTSASG